MADATEPVFAIAQVASILGVPVATLRSWERRYRVLRPARTTGGHRRYSEADVERIRILRDEIRRGHRPREAASRLRAAAPIPSDQAPAIDRFEQLALSLDGAALRALLDGSSVSIGIERTLEEVALASLRRIGDHWKSGECGVAHEHVATHEIRSWIARQMSLAPAAFRAGAVVLASAPEDQHSVGLEGFGLLLARRGWRIVLLGPRTPIDALVDAVEVSAAAAAIVACQWTQARRSAVAAVRAVGAAGTARAFFAGAAFEAAGKRAGVPGTHLDDRPASAVGEFERALAAP